MSVTGLEVCRYYFTYTRLMKYNFKTNNKNQDLRTYSQGTIVTSLTNGLHQRKQQQTSNAITHCERALRNTVIKIYSRMVLRRVQFWFSLETKQICVKMKKPVL